MVSRNLRFRFTLVSYNILSQTLLNHHGYLYSSCNPRDLEWPRRGHKIVSELLNNQADIICLQEVESEHLQSLYRPRLARCGYECVYKKKTGYMIDGCAIFYKSKLFHLLNYKGIEFNRTDVTNLLNKDNVGIIAVLKPRISTRSRSSHLVIANTHLIFNPKRSDIRLAQLKYFLSELEELSFDTYNSDNDERCHHATILCGDMNSTPDSDISKFILKNSVLNQGNVDRTITNDTEQQPDSCQKDINDTAQDKIVTNDDHNDDDDETQTTATKVSTNDDHNYDNQSKFIPNNKNLDNDHNNVADKEDATDDNTDDNNDINTNRRRSGCIITGERSLSDFSHSLEFESAYPTENTAGQRYISTFSSCIVDYIFYTPKQLELDSYREMFTDEQLKDIGPLPSAEFPSDHFSLEAKFVLK